MTFICPNTVVDLIDLSISTCHILRWCDLEALAKNINGQYVLLTVYKLRGGALKADKYWCIQSQNI